MSLLRLAVSVLSILLLTTIVGCSDDDGGTSGGDATTAGDDASTTSTDGGDDPGPTDAVEPEDDAGNGTPDISAPDPDPEPEPEPEEGDSMDEATPAEVGAPFDAALSPTGDVDWFKFEGAAGDAIAIRLVAQGEDHIFDKEYIDTVVTLYDEAGVQLAVNDDPYPRTTNDSEIYTVLPADGPYHLKVEECWNWAVTLGLSCAEPQNKTGTDYSLEISVLDPTTAGYAEEIEAGNTAAEATALTFAPDAEGAYETGLLHGTFADTADVDVFSFQVPTDSPVEKGRGGIFFGFYPGGEYSNGGADASLIWVADASAPDVAIAQSTNDLGSFISVPVTYGAEYLLYVAHAQEQDTANPFYFARYAPSEGNPLEQDEVGNDTWEGAEALVVAEQENGVTFHFVEGDLINDATDVDHYSIDLPATIPDGSTVLVSCNGWQLGSGLRGLKIQLYTDDGDALSGSKVETASAGANLDQFPASSYLGMSKAILKVWAGSQAEDVTGTWYRCGFHLVTPAPEGDFQ